MLSPPLPKVTIAIPTYNEAAHIERVLTELLSTRYPAVLEVLVIDGGSTDGTQKIVQKIVTRDTRCRLLHNPHKIQSAGLNLALAHAQGDVFLRADAHCSYAIDYVERCVETLLQTGALNVGGAQRFVATNAFQAGVALASRSFLFSGIAPYRNPTYEGYAETVFLGCFWKRVLDILGGYHTEMLQAEDIELNLRLLQMTSHAVYISPHIKVWYYPKVTWQAFVQQYIGYGQGSYTITRQHSYLVHRRGLIPIRSMVVGLLTLATDRLVLRGVLRTRCLIPLMYILPWLEGFRLAYAYRETFETEFWRASKANMPSFMQQWLWCSVVLTIAPHAHAIGFLQRLILDTIRRILQ
jgi:glycosyltransferase involved in cell wall biosynthesis